MMMSSLWTQNLSHAISLGTVVMLAGLTLTVGCSSQDDIRLLRDPQKMKNEILHHIPNGTTLARAQEIMVTNSFQCERVQGGDFLLWSDGASDTRLIENVDYLYCLRYKHLGWEERKWQIALIYTNGVVRDIAVSYHASGICGP